MPLQEPTKDVTDYEIAKKCLDDHDSYAWERTAQDKRDDSIRWLEGKVRELEVRSWVLSRTLPKALQAGALRCIRQQGLSTAQPYCGQRLSLLCRSQEEDESELQRSIYHHHHHHHHHHRLQR